MEAVGESWHNLEGDTMLVCDSCEGREDVQKTQWSITILDSTNIAKSASDRTITTDDLCVHCRNRLEMTIKAAVRPLPKLAIGNAV